MSPLVCTAADEILADAEDLDPLMGDRLVSPHRRSRFAHDYQQQLTAEAPTEADAALRDAVALADALVVASVGVIAQAWTVLAQHLVTAVDPIRVFGVAIDRAVSPLSLPPYEPSDRASALLLALDSPGTTACALWAAVFEAPLAPHARKLDCGHASASDAVERAAKAVAQHLRRYATLVAHDDVVDPARLSEMCFIRIALLATAAFARSEARHL